LEGFQTFVRLGGYIGGIYSAHDVQAFHAMVTICCKEPKSIDLRFHYHAH
jgi:hypothetical protein